MARKRRERIETDVLGKPRPGLNAAFAGLELANVAGAPATEPPPPSPKPAVWQMGRVVLRRERAHRGGRTVIVVDDFATHLPQSIIERVAKKLRVACGCGGTVKERSIEVQGDQAAKVRSVLEAEGFQVAGEK